jgi:4'-phosphopantetheinyl transferase
MVVLYGLLDGQERERVARYRFEHLRAHAIAARGLLRRLLAAYLGREPTELRFQYGPFGKPDLVGDERIFFNVAHSGGRGLYAVSRDGAVGIDIELVRSNLDHRGLGRGTFSVAEQAMLASATDDHAARQGFFRCWTMKEAYIKARGGGLSIPLDSFDVPLQAGYVHSREAAPCAHGWYVAPLDVGPEAAAAVAYRDSACEVRASTGL